MENTVHEVILDSGEINGVPYKIAVDIEVGSILVSFQHENAENDSTTGPGSDNGPIFLFRFTGKKPYSLSKIKPKLVIYSSESYKTFSDFDIANNLTMGQDYLRKLVAGNPHTQKSIIVIAHGFCNSSKTPWVIQMKDACIAADPGAIVILLDWCYWLKSVVPKFLKYSRSAASVVNVGGWLANFLQETGIPETVFLWGIGHSLGAHLMGFCGRMLKTSGREIDRISGLDPAGPGFENGDDFLESHALTKESAKFVDVIHTDGKTWTWSDILSRLDVAIWPINNQPPADGGVREIFYHLGTMEPMGHLDFYPNWGRVNNPMLNPDINSHSMAHVYFNHSIRNPNSFVTNEKIVHRPAAGESPEVQRTRDGPNVKMGYHCKRYDGMAPTTSECYYIPTTTDAEDGFE